MFTIKTLNAISPVGLAKLNKNLFDVSVGTDVPDGILVRSADLLNTTFNDNLLAIARAGAGVNNIPLDRCSEQGIVVFNTPGANANAVAELVIGMLIAGSRNVAAAAQWTQGLAGDPAMAKSVEKGKKQFVGNEIKGKTLGVIGLGAIGSRVANCAIELGMEVYGYDPYISIDAAWNLSSQVHHCVNLNDMLPLCDYITIHVPYLPTTKDTINAQTLALCKDGVKLRIVSVPSEGLFRSQAPGYQESVIPANAKVFGLTAGLPVTLEGLVGAHGKVWGLESFGFSAPYKVLDEKLGFTAENVYKQVKAMI